MAQDTLAVSPQSKVRPADVEIGKELRKALASSLREAYDTTISQRSGLDDSIVTAERNYEMMTVPRTFPWKNASNVFLPLIREAVDTVVSTTVADVFVPSFFLVLPTTEEAAHFSHKVQRYYNAELTRPRYGENTWQKEARGYVNLSAMHGTAYMDVTWMKRTSKQRVAVLVDDTDPETGVPVLDLEKGEPLQKWDIHEITYEDYNDVLWEALELREVVLVPAHAKSVEKADLVIRIMYFTENDLRAMCRPGPNGEKPLLWKDAVDRIVGTISTGDTELTQDPRGTETYEIDGQVGVGGTTTHDVDGRLKTTVYEILRIDSKMFEHRRGEGAQHMIYYLHRQTETLAGAIPFPYNHGKRTTVALSLMERTNRAYGYGVPESLRTIQTEVNGNINQENDQINLRLAAPRYQLAGVKVLGGENGEWGPNTVFLVQSPNDVGLLNLGEVIPSSERMLDRLYSMSGRIIGQTAPGVRSPGKRQTAQEIKSDAQARNVRGAFFANNVRASMSEVFWLTHWLKIQYAPEQISFSDNTQGRPEQLTLTKQELVQDYELLIAGMGGPLDEQGDRQDSMLLHQQFTQRPDIQQDPVKLYAFDRDLLDAFKRPNAEQLIGTPQAAQEKLQAMQQAAQQQQAAAQQAAAMGQPPPGQEQQGGGKPQQQQQQGPPGLGGGGLGA